MPQVRGYVLGRLFAFLAMHGALEQPAEQLYSQASTRPPQVIPKALGSFIETGKEEQLFPLMKSLPLEAFDGPLNPREQGAFALGYMHERAGYAFPSFDDESEGEAKDLTERYEFRLEPQLKEWIKLQGGGTFIRTLLRNERTRQEQETTSGQQAEGHGEH